ncbi:MAG: hypothetical protein Q9174_000077 [Haloplaca sp. 1 TL-2023]
MDSQDGPTFVKSLAQFVRTHEKALANALQIRQQSSRGGQDPDNNTSAPSIHGGSSSSLNASSSVSSALAAALSFASLNFTSQSIKPAKLTLTPHHLFYLLSRFEELGVSVGPLSVRTENLHAEASPANYVSFLSQAQRPHGRSDRDSIHSVSSVRSVMSGMSVLWSNLGSSSSAAKSEKTQAQLTLDLKYLYSAFTKIPSLRLSSGRTAHLIRDYEEFPFDTAVPLFAFKNLSVLEICGVDFRQFFGWDRLADQLRSLTVKHANVDDPVDIFTSIVLDDMDKRRRRSSKNHPSPILTWPTSPPLRFAETAKVPPTLCSPISGDQSGQSASPQDGGPSTPRNPSVSPHRPLSSRQNVSFRHVRGNSTKIKRSGSGSSDSSLNSNSPSIAAYKPGSSSNLQLATILPASKWRFLRHVSLADNALTSISAGSLAPLSNTLRSLDLSSNLFTDVPDGISDLTVLRALNLSHCMIEGLQSLIRNPLPAITALNVRANRLHSIVGIERLLSLERLDVRENRMRDPTELSRLTGLPDFREVWVARNPFTRSHGRYRLTIFNLFRSTPGLMDDITIDGSSPLYNERRHLVDRAKEGEPVSVMKTTSSETESLPPASNVSQQDLPSRLITSSQSYGQGHKAEAESVEDLKGFARPRRFKKSTKRQRLVDLAVDQAMPPGLEPFAPISFVMTQDARAQTAGATTSCRGTDLEGEPDISKALMSSRPKSSAKVYPESEGVKSESITAQPRGAGWPSSDGNEPLSMSSAQDNRLKAHAYRQKVESLKKEVGSNWLSALGEDAWNGDREIDASPSSVREAKPALPLLHTHNRGIT